MSDLNVEAMAERWRQEIIKRLTRAAVHTQNELRKTVSIAAPRRRVTSRRGVARYVATTPAAKGAPPRKLSGRGRAGMAYFVDKQKLEAVVGTNVFYMGVHERDHHKFVEQTLTRERGRINDLLSGVKM